MTWNEAQKTSKYLRKNGHSQVLPIRFGEAWAVRYFDKYDRRVTVQKPQE